MKKNPLAIYNAREDGYLVNDNNIEIYTGALSQVEQMMKDDINSAVVIAVPKDKVASVDGAKQWLKENAFVSIDGKSHNLLYHVPTALQAAFYSSYTHEVGIEPGYDEDDMSKVKEFM